MAGLYFSLNDPEVVKAWERALTELFVAQDPLTGWFGSRLAARFGDGMLDADGLYDPFSPGQGRTVKRGLKRYYLPPDDFECESCGYVHPWRPQLCENCGADGSTLMQVTQEEIAA